jgi:hypothetical protein
MFNTGQEEDNHIYETPPNLDGVPAEKGGIKLTSQM